MSDEEMQPLGITIPPQLMDQWSEMNAVNRAAAWLGDTDSECEDAMSNSTPGAQQVSRERFYQVKASAELNHYLNGFQATDLIAYAEQEHAAREAAERELYLVQLARDAFRDESDKERHRADALENQTVRNTNDSLLETAGELRRQLHEAEVKIERVESWMRYGIDSLEIVAELQRWMDGTSGVDSPAGQEAGE